MLGQGSYEKMYTTLQSIGKGAFGFVKMASRKTDDQVVSDAIFHFCVLDSKQVGLFQCVKPSKFSTRQDWLYLGCPQDRLPSNVTVTIPKDLLSKNKVL